MRERERAACVTCVRSAMQAADEGSLSTLHWTTAAVHLELGWHCLLCPHGPAWAGLWLTGHGRVKGRLIEHADELEMSNKCCGSLQVLLSSITGHITCWHSFRGSERPQDILSQGIFSIHLFIKKYFKKAVHTYNELNTSSLWLICF